MSCLEVHLKKMTVASKGVRFKKATILKIKPLFYRPNCDFTKCLIVFKNHIFINCILKLPFFKPHILKLLNQTYPKLYSSWMEFKMRQKHAALTLFFAVNTFIEASKIVDCGHIILQNLDIIDGL
jgi:hypothetical protein